MNQIDEFMRNQGLALTLIASFLAVMIAQLFIVFVRNRYASPSLASFRVTLLGPPESGKTSAAIAVLDYMINSHLSGYLRLRGSSTIDSVEQGIMLLNEGIFPQPTIESSTNVYRLDYFPPQLWHRKLLASLIPIPRAYRVEIADFAGELTDEFADPDRSLRAANVPTSFGEDAPSNYLKWVAESDRCLLFIDMDRFVSEGDRFANALTAKYIAFWQRYLDLHSTDMQPRSGTPVVIVHSKCDVLSKSDGPLSNVALAELTRIARERSTPAFARLYHFMRANSREVSLVFMSVVRATAAGSRMGVNELAAAVLPDVSNRRQGTGSTRPAKSARRSAGRSMKAQTR